MIKARVIRFIAVVSAAQPSPVGRQPLHRIADHQREGWRVTNTSLRATGAETTRAERLVFSALEEAGIERAYLQRDQMRAGGYTEMPSDAAITRRALLAIVSDAVAAAASK